VPHYASGSDTEPDGYSNADTRVYCYVYAMAFLYAFLYSFVYSMALE
jgi:hypothetical protein